MPTLTRYTIDFETPLLGTGLFAFTLVDFIADVGIGTIEQLGKRGIDRHSMVVATLCELTSAPGHPFDFPFIGAAPMEVRNVAPRDGGVVSLWIHVEWLQPIHVRLSLLVIND